MNYIKMKNIGLIILAIEESSRLEKSLQLLNTEPAVFLQDDTFSCPEIAIVF